MVERAATSTAADRVAAAMGGRLFVLVVFAAAVFTAILFVIRAEKIFDFPAVLSDATREDLLAFWRAGQMALQGEAAAAYDAALFRAGLPEHGQGLLLLNPPHFFLLAAPLGLFSYGEAKALFLVPSLAALAGASAIAAGRTPARSWAVALMLFSPAAFASFLVYQLGPFVALGLCAALLCARERPILAGLLLALLTMKPQFGLLAPVFLIATRDWRAIFYGAAFTAALVAISVAIFGIAPWQVFFASIGGAYGAHAAPLYRDMITIHQSIGKLGGAEAVRTIGQLAAMLLAVAGVFIAASRWERRAAVGFTLLAAVIASPSVWVYDWPLVAAGLICLAGATGPWPLSLQFIAALAWLGPFFSLGPRFQHNSVIAPVILAATIAAIFLWRRARARPAAPQGSLGVSGGVSAGVAGGVSGEAPSTGASGAGS